MIHSFVVFAAIVAVGMSGMVGCDLMSKPKVAKAKKKKAKAKTEDGENADGTWGTKPAVAGQPAVAGKPLTAGKPVDRSKPAGGPSGSGMPAPMPVGQPFAAGSLSQVRGQTEYLTNETATDRVGWEIVDALEDRATLAVWLFDRTTSAASQRAAVTRRLGDVFRGFDELKKKGHKAFDNTSNGPPLLNVIAAYGKTCEILTPEPTDDTEALVGALNKITDEPDGSEMTFSAIQNVLDEFLKFRTEKKRLIMFTVVTDERGQDAEKVDALVPLFEKYAIPCYVIGPPAKFGGEIGLAAGKAGIGPESLAKETIDLDFPSPMGGGFGGGGFRGGQAAAADTESFDSGFGPFALSRLAKLSGGSYLIVRGGGFGQFQAGGARKFDAKIMAKYAPDYVSKAEYDALLKENKCRMALHNAAMEKPVEVNKGVNLQLQFVKQDEAKLKVACDMAQRSVARIEPMLRPLTEALKPLDADRAKLTGPRWQAAYDLAVGRVLANRARYEGYNTMVAQFKQGKRPGGPDDNVWMIVPSEGFPSDSSIDKMVKQSRKYLERVVKEHPGTPWEIMATRELNSSCGWEAKAK